MRPAEALQTGAVLLAPALIPHGFSFAMEGAGGSSGGDFANGAFVRGTRRLELHVRLSSLGLVAYHVGAFTLPHVDYVRAQRARGISGEQSYPGFGSDPMQAFSHLLSDLRVFGDVFTQGTEPAFANLAHWVIENPAPIGFGAVP